MLESEDVIVGASNDGNMHTASIFSGGSLSVVIAMLSLIVAVASLGINLASKKKRDPEESENENGN